MNSIYMFVKFKLFFNIININLVICFLIYGSIFKSNIQIKPEPKWLGPAAQSGSIFPDKLGEFPFELP